MTIIGKAIGFVFVTGLLAAGAVVYASERGGEVVTLRTFGGNGLGSDTSVWVVDDRPVLYVRASRPDRVWLMRMSKQHQVELMRDGVSRRYQAVPAPEMRRRVDHLIRTKYGWADELLELLREPGETVPVRLEPETI